MESPREREGRELRGDIRGGGGEDQRLSGLGRTGDLLNLTDHRGVGERGTCVQEDEHPGRFEHRHEGQRLKGFSCLILGIPAIPG
ncbi:MAG: hypothetical protein ACRDHO_07810, partial [Actinomycetota bacterium]